MVQCGTVWYFFCPPCVFLCLFRLIFVGGDLTGERVDAKPRFRSGDLIGEMTCNW